MITKKGKNKLILKKSLSLKLNNFLLKLNLRKTEKCLNQTENDFTFYFNRFIENESKIEFVNFVHQYIQKNNNLNTLCNIICHKLQKFLSVDMCFIAIFDKTSHKFILKTNLKNKKVTFIKDFLSKKHCYEMISSPKNKFNLSDMQTILPDNYKMLPLINKSKIYGYIFLYKKDAKFLEQSIKLFDYAVNCSHILLINCYLNSEIIKDKEQKVVALADVSHEMKTPLNAINGFASILYEDNVSDEKRTKYLKNIMSSASHLLQVAEYTVEMARVETNNLHLDYETFESDILIKEVLNILSEFRKRKNIELTVDLDKCLLCADVKQFRQIIFNLISNAYKYTFKNGKVSVKTRHDSKYFYFEVQDNGQGINYNEQGVIFEFFTHVLHVQNDGEESTGIGLSLCKKIIDLHQGEISFISEPGKGSLFYFYLPLKKPACAVRKSKKNSKK